MTGKGLTTLLASDHGFVKMAPGELRVAAIGTSLTARGGWLTPLADALALQRARPARVGMFAEPGATSTWGLSQVDAVIAFQPDLILVEFATNDAAIHRAVSLPRSACNMTQLLTALRNGAPQASMFVMAMNPIHGLRGALRPRLDRYVEAHCMAAQAIGAGFIDHRPAWLAHSAYERRKMIPDGAHPIAACAVTLMLPRIMERLAVTLPSTKTPEHVR